MKRVNTDQDELIHFNIAQLNNDTQTNLQTIVIMLNYKKCVITVFYSFITGRLSKIE